jgi:hypothetical protein
MKGEPNRLVPSSPLSTGQAERDAILCRAFVRAQRQRSPAGRFRYYTDFNPPSIDRHQVGTHTFCRIHRIVRRLSSDG